MDIAIIDVEIYSKIHTFRFVYDNFHDGKWNTKLIDDTRTVISRFESPSMRESFELAAEKIMLLGDVRKIGSTSNNYDSYPTLLFHYFIKKRPKDREIWIDCTA